MGARLIVLGTGHEKLVAGLVELARRHPDRIAVLELAVEEDDPVTDSFRAVLADLEAPVNHGVALPAAEKVLAA